MKKIFLAILVSLLGFSVNAQDKKLKKEIDNKTNVKSELEMQLMSIDLQIDKVKNRSLRSDDEYIKKKLASYKDIKALYEDEAFQRKLKESKFAETYSSIEKMYKSILGDGGGYKPLDNDLYKIQIDRLRDELVKLKRDKIIIHKDSFLRSFDDLSELIKDYKFTMSELLRVFDVVDYKSQKMPSSEIYQSLQDDHETEYIDKIPFTKYLLEKYINSDNFSRGKIREYHVFSTIK